MMQAQANRIMKNKNIVNRQRAGHRAAMLSVLLAAVLMFGGTISPAAVYAADQEVQTGFFTESADDVEEDADAEGEDGGVIIEDVDETNAADDQYAASDSEEPAEPEMIPVDIEDSSIIVARKKSAQLRLTSWPDDGLIWSSDKASVATIDEYGVVKGISPGTAIITCRAAGDSENYDSCKVTVKFGIGEAVFLAHKGYSSIAPENTLPAIREAVRAGFDGVEMDVYELKKEKRKKYRPFILISHDNTLKRLTGKKGKIDRLTHKNYKKYKIRYHVNGLKTYGPQTFPTLEQALKTAWREADKAGKKNFIVELDIKQKTISKAAVKKIIRLAGRHRVRINSPHYQVIAKFKKYRKYKTTELWMFKDSRTVAQRKAFISKAAKLKVKGVSMPPECWNSSLIRYAKKKHLKLATRTNDTKQAQKLIDKGFERVCTSKKMFTD